MSLVGSGTINDLKQVGRGVATGFSKYWHAGGQLRELYRVTRLIEDNGSLIRVWLVPIQNPLVFSSTGNSVIRLSNITLPKLIVVM